MNTILRLVFDAFSRHTAYADPLPSYLKSPKVTNFMADAGINDFPSFIEMILKFIVDAGTPFIAVAFIWTGLQYVLAQGNPEKLKTAHKTLKYTLIGAGLILGSFVITRVISSTLGEVIS
jgi:hypothetical protein